MTLAGKPFENIVGKEANAGNQHFLLFPHVFYPFQNKFQFFNHTIKPLLETTSIKRPPALRDHCPDTKTLLKST